MKSAENTEIFIGMFSKNHIIRIVNKIKNISRISIQRRNWDDAIRMIEIAAKIQEWYYYYQFVDPEIESMLCEISDNLFPNPSKNSSRNNRFVFCDSFVWDNHCLTQQYLRAMFDMNVDILFIICNPESERSERILYELKRYRKATIYEVPESVSRSEQSKLIYQQIIQYQPSKIFLQTLSVVFVVALNALKHIPRYRINLADHLFWAGTHCFDYLIEFRNFGFTVSYQKRDIPKERILLQPFYPIIDLEKRFEGFPIEIKNKTIMFSGGAVYKTSDKHNTFFEMMKRLLLENPSLIILFAARGDDEKLRSYINTHNLQNRLFLLGYRKDITEVYNNIDLFLQTYPIAGGLMSQYAAVYGKPIISYSQSNMLAFNKVLDDSLFMRLGFDYRTTFTEFDSFYAEAKKLITDITYRESVGKLLPELIITPREFTKELGQLVSTNKNVRHPEEVFIDYKEIEKVLLGSRIEFRDELKIFIISNFRFHSIILFPRLTLQFVPTLLTKYYKELLNHIVGRFFSKLKVQLNGSRLSQ